MTRVLVVEDDPKIRANLLFQLREEGLAPQGVESAEAALVELEPPRRALPDLLLVDIRLPSMSGVELVSRLAGAGRLPPTIVVSGEATISETVQALQLGVYDFIEKPISRERLLQSVRNALEREDLTREVARLADHLDVGTEILGGSPVIEHLRRRIAQAAPTDAGVLITGESGTGKELVAEALHRGSRRARQPLVKVNCAAIPPNLIEAEFFGHASGAFTGADRAKGGLFEAADGGTLFLDEIGDMDFGLQSRLLRVLEDGSIRRVGETRDRSVDVRLVAATHNDLEEAIAARAFREDLYFRLAQLPIEVPPLRERGEDIKELFRHFLARACRRHHAGSRRISDGVEAVLARHSWPGNVRELKNLCERLVVLGEDPITTEQLRASGLDAAGAARAPENAAKRGAVLPLRDFRRQAERGHIERVLDLCRWNVTAAAGLLELGRTSLHQKMTALGIRRPAEREGVDSESP